MSNRWTWSQTQVLWSHAHRWLPFLFFSEICLCFLVLTSRVLALGMFLEHIQLSFFSSQFLQIQPIGPKKCWRKDYVSSLHSRTLVSLLFSSPLSSLLKVLPLGGPGRSDQSPLVPLLVSLFHFSPWARTKSKVVER